MAAIDSRSDVLLLSEICWARSTCCVEFKPSSMAFEISLACIDLKSYDIVKKRQYNKLYGYFDWFVPILNKEIYLHNIKCHCW